MKASVIGIDLSKNVFHVVVKNHRGKILQRRKFSRKRLLEELSKYERDILICMETCQGARISSGANCSAACEAVLKPTEE